MFVIGYYGDPTQLSEDQQKSEAAPRKRKPLSETIYGPNWGEAADFL